jgi:hypothetical protein
MVLPLEGWSDGGSVMMTTPWSCGCCAPAGGGGGGGISGEIAGAALRGGVAGGQTRPRGRAMGGGE